MTKVTIERELLPCPFCGGTDLHSEPWCVMPDNYHASLVSCADCEFEGPSSLTLTEPDGCWMSDEESAIAEGIKAWNRRAAPRQPEGEGLEVVAWQDAENPLYTTAERRVLHDWVNNGYPIVELCRLSDHQRAIAELREECERVKADRASCWAEFKVMTRSCLEAEKERDTLRQQLAERDAEIERLRVKLMTIASAEPGRHNIEWAKAMAATGNNEAYAKWREAFDQRDKLAGLLRDVRPIVALEVERWARAAALLPVNTTVESGLLTRIDAALAEVK